MARTWLAAAAALMLATAFPPHAGFLASRTTVSIRGGDFLINGRPTFNGRRWRGYRIEGLLPNARMVQGIFDDLNPETRGRWAYPDTGRWDAERNTRVRTTTSTSTNRATTWSPPPPCTRPGGSSTIA